MKKLEEELIKAKQETLDMQLRHASWEAQEKLRKQVEEMASDADVLREKLAAALEARELAERAAAGGGAMAMLAGVEA